MELDPRFTNAIDEAPSLRTAQFSDLEIVTVKDDLIFDGYAAVFAERADLGEHTEELRHGAFRKFLSSGANIPLVHEHDRSQLLGTTKSGRVRLTEEPRGLRVQANLAKTDLSQRIKSLVESGDITGMSWGAVVGRSNSDWSYRDSKPHRVIKGFNQVLDVCTTFDPAYAGAEAQFRSLAFAHPESAGALQQLLLGVYPQHEEEETRSAVEVDEESEEVPSGVSSSLAAKKRHLQLMGLTLEGDDFR